MDIKPALEQIYRDYENRNISAFIEVLPDNFCFEWPVEPAYAKYSGRCENKSEFLSQLGNIAENFEFNSYSASNIIVEGNRAAAQVSLNITSKKTKETFDTTIAHFWTFEGDKPIRLVEYMDTALVTNLV